MKLDIKKEEKISGVLSSLYWFLSRTDHQIVNMRRVTINKNGEVEVKLEEKGLDGVRFHFVKKGERIVKKLTYFSCDISDDGFEEENPELLVFLNNVLIYYKFLYNNWYFAEKQYRESNYYP